MKKDQDSKFAKSFSDALRLWLRANRNRVILMVVLLILALSFFAGEKLFSDPGGKSRNGTGAETGQSPETRENETEVIASGSETEDHRPSEEPDSESAIRLTAMPVPPTEESSEEPTERPSATPVPPVEESSEESTERPGVTPVPPMEESSDEPTERPTVTPVPPVEESSAQTTAEPTPQPTATPVPPAESETQTSEIETEEPTVPETRTDAEDGYILCTITISCEHVFDDPDLVPAEKWLVIPEDGRILPPTEMKVKEGSTVYQVLRAACEQNGILLDAALFSAYVRGIGNLYEFDLGRQSGWMYEVNGYYPPVGCGSYRVEDGDAIVWNYTCSRGDLQPEDGKDNGSNLK